MIELIENNLTLLILITCLVIFFIWLGWKIRLWWKNFLFMLVRKRGKKGERTSIQLLKKNGYTVLDEQINNLRHDDFDFLNKDLIKNPDETVIKKLNKLYEEEAENRKNALKFEKVNVVRIDSSDTVDWLEQSEIPLFKKKRAAKLARLLEARKLFNEVNLEKYPSRGYATLIHKSNEKGKEIVSRVLREISLKALAENIMDVSVCGSVHPYSEIIGGKLIASLMASQEIRNLFREILMCLLI